MAIKVAIQTLTVYPSCQKYPPQGSPPITQTSEPPFSSAFRRLRKSRLYVEKHTFSGVRMVGTGLQLPLAWAKLVENLVEDFLHATVTCELVIVIDRCAILGEIEMQYKWYCD